MKTFCRCLKQLIWEKTFEHPITGLRLIHESVEHFGFAHGDRIGHGIALGLNIDEWANMKPTVAVPIEEYFDDLVWLRSILLQVDWGDGRKYLSDLESEMLKIANSLYKSKRKDSDGIYNNIQNITFTPDLFYRTYRARFEQSSLEKNGVLVKRTDFNFDGDIYWWEEGLRKPANSTSEQDHQKMLRAFLYSRSLWHNAKRLGEWEVYIDDAYIQRAKTAQKFLQKYVSKLGISIEACPSSNKVIGNLGTYSNHPVFNMAPPMGPALFKVTINADDPITFNTNVHEEHMHLRDSLVRDLKVPATQAELWLEQRNKDANETSFLRNQNLNIL